MQFASMNYFYGVTSPTFDHYTFLDVPAEFVMTLENIKVTHLGALKCQQLRDASLGQHPHSLNQINSVKKE